MRQLAHLFKALADPTRLRIVNLLLEGALCVCEMETILGLPQPLLSRHLAYLRGAGIVLDKRQGARVQYSLVPDHELLTPLRFCLRQVLLSQDVCREDLRRLTQLSGVCCPAGASQPSVAAKILVQPGESRENQGPHV
jgi:ArsR family transcriptional regulator